MGEKTVLPISKTDLGELMRKLRDGEWDDIEEAVEEVCNLFWEAIHCQRRREVSCQTR
jgi:hypothetical protein